MSVAVKIGFVLGCGLSALGCAANLAESEPASPRPSHIAGLADVPSPAQRSPSVVETPQPSRRTLSSKEEPDEPSASSETTLSGAERRLSSSASSSSTAARQTCPLQAGGRALKRSALHRTLDGGLGAWLRGVDVEPNVDRGRFQGWRVRSVYKGDPCWESVDLRAGDVVNRVNHRPIERPEEAQAVWTALRKSGEIVVDLVRDGRPRVLRFTVAD